MEQKCPVIIIHVIFLKVYHFIAHLFKTNLNEYFSIAEIGADVFETSSKRGFNVGGFVLVCSSAVKSGMLFESSWTPVD